MLCGRHNAKPLVVVQMTDFRVSALTNIVLTNWEFTSRHIPNVPISCDKYNISDHPVPMPNLVNELERCYISTSYIVHQMKVEVWLGILHQHRVINIRNRIY